MPVEITLPDIQRCNRLRGLSVKLCGCRTEDGWLECPPGAIGVLSSGLLTDCRRLVELPSIYRGARNSPARSARTAAERAWCAPGRARPASTAAKARGVFVMAEPSYTISADGRAITCARCGMTSYNRHDVAEWYCGNCHISHGDFREFDCTDCGRHILSFAHPNKAPELCNACTLIPGWWGLPTIAAVLDPDNVRRPRTLQ